MRAEHIMTALYDAADEVGEVTATYVELTGLVDPTGTLDSHERLLAMNESGYFISLSCSSNQFTVRLGMNSHESCEPRRRLLDSIARLVKDSGRWEGSLDSLRQAVGPDASKWDIHGMLLALRDEGRIGNVTINGAGASAWCEVRTRI